MINSTPNLGQLISRSVVIPDGETKSAAIALNGFALVGILIGVLTGTGFTFEVSDAEDGTFVPMSAGTSGTALDYTVAQNTYAAIDPKDFLGVNFIKLVSDAQASGDETVTIMLKGL